MRFGKSAESECEQRFLLFGGNCAAELPVEPHSIFRLRVLDVEPGEAQSFDIRIRLDSGFDAGDFAAVETPGEVYEIREERGVGVRAAISALRR